MKISVKAKEHRAIQPNEKTDKSDKTTRAKERFLKALACSSTITAAATRARIARQHAYQWRESDTVFAQAWLEARDMFADGVEDLIWKRAKEGDRTCLLRLAQRLRPREWSTKNLHEHHSEIAATAGVVILPELEILELDKSSESL